MVPLLTLLLAQGSLKNVTKPKKGALVKVWLLGYKDMVHRHMESWGGLMVFVFRV